MSGDPKELLRLYLRQRRELGDEELVLDRHSPAEVRAVMAEAERPRAAAPPPPTRSAPPPLPPRGPDPGDAPERPLHRRVGAPVPGSTPMPQAPDSPARGIGADAIRLLPTLDAVRDVSLGCPRCRLAEGRLHVVFGEGDPNAEIMVVGEAPGEQEDRTGRPFVGKAGKLLDLILATVGVERERVYICNVLKCRPPANRNPKPDEVEACSPYLLRQVELVKPRVIVAFGAFAAQTLLGVDTPIGKLRGRSHVYQPTPEHDGVPLVATYHPAGVLRNPGWIRAVWDDLQRVRSVVDRAASN
ncbi:MAG TPA: uracil-DNA glycosylase [Longimicrobium sp.]